MRAASPKNQTATLGETIVFSRQPKFALPPHALAVCAAGCFNRSCPASQVEATVLSSPIVMIPARMASTRLPNKPLALIHGRPMIVQVLQRALEADVAPVVVAAAEQEILEAVEAAGGRALLTDPALPSGSDRIHQALEQLDPVGRHDTVINLQGDL